MASYLDMSCSWMYYRDQKCYRGFLIISDEALLLLELRKLLCSDPCTDTCPDRFCHQGFNSKYRVSSGQNKPDV